MPGNVRLRLLALRELKGIKLLNREKFFCAKVVVKKNKHASKTQKFIWRSSIAYKNLTYCFRRLALYAPCPKNLWYFSTVEKKTKFKFFEARAAHISRTFQDSDSTTGSNSKFCHRYAGVANYTFALRAVFHNFSLRWRKLFLKWQVKW